MTEQTTHGAGSPVRIEVWADLACPWCYVGKHRLQAAIAERADADRFEVVMRSFELNPSATRTPETIEQAFRRSHGGSAVQVMQAERQIQELARAEGLGFSLDRLNSNTFDFHRVLQYANEQGLGAAFFAAVQDPYFAGALNPFAPDALADAAEWVGLHGQRVREVLAGDEYAEQVHADRAEGLGLGVSGVPFTVFGRRLAAPGAQSVAVYRQALDQIAGPAPVESVA